MTTAIIIYELLTVLFLTSIYYAGRIAMVRTRMDAVSHLQRVLVSYIRRREAKAPGGTPNVTRYERELLEDINQFLAIEENIIDKETPALFRYMERSALKIQKRIEERRAKKPSHDL